MLRWKSKNFSASSREPETAFSCYCKGVTKGAENNMTCLHPLACPLLSQAVAQRGRMSSNFLSSPALSFKRTLIL